MTSDKETLSHFAMALVGMKSDGGAAVARGFMLAVKNDGEISYLDPSADEKVFSKAAAINKDSGSYKWKFFESHADMTAFVEHGRRKLSGSLPGDDTVVDAAGGKGAVLDAVGKKGDIASPTAPHDG